MKELNDIDDIEPWLESQAPHVSVVFASRCALRAFPHMGDAPHSLLRKHVLNVVRALLTSSVCARFQRLELVRQCSSAAIAVHGSEDSNDFQGGPFRGSKIHTAIHCAEMAIRAATVHVADHSALPEFGHHGPIHSMARSSIMGPLNDVIEAQALTDARWIKKERKVANVLDQPLGLSAPMSEECERGLSNIRYFFNCDKHIWSFWLRWFEGFLNGEPVNWHLQRAIAELPSDDWKKGPGWISEKIISLDAYLNDEGATTAPLERGAPEPSASEIQDISERILQNRDALTLVIADVLSQINTYREYLRCRNDGTPSERDELIKLLDSITQKLRELLNAIPLDSSPISNESAKVVKRWLQDFQSLIPKEAKKYSDPENVVQAVIPTGIILGCTAVGALLGAPIAGSVVGGLITGQLKPANAAEDLLGSSKPN